MIGKKYSDLLPQAALTRPFTSVAFVLLALGLYLQALVFAVHTPWGKPPDEPAHMSYIADVARSGALLPDYAGNRVDGVELNYLNHPFLYYALLGKWVAATGGAAESRFVELRMVSAAFVALGFLFWMFAARNLGVGLPACGASAIACAAIPMYSFNAGSVNNDNLAYLGVGLVALGMSMAARDRAVGARATAAIAAGVLIAFLTKATAATFVLFFLAAMVFRQRRPILFWIRRPRNAISCASVALLCAAYYLPVWLKYSTPFPRPRSLWAHLPPPEHPLSWWRYAGYFAGEMCERLPIVLARENVQSYPASTTLLFYAMIALPIAVWIPVRCATHLGREKENVRCFGDSVSIALACTVILHIAASYRGYLQHLQPPLIQPRYYLHLLPGLFLLPWSMLKPGPLRKALLIAWSLLAAACVCISMPQTFAQLSSAP